MNSQFNRSVCFAVSLMMVTPNLVFGQETVRRELINSPVELARKDYRSFDNLFDFFTLRDPRNNFDPISRHRLRTHLFQRDVTIDWDVINEFAKSNFDKAQSNTFTEMSLQPIKASTAYHGPVLNDQNAQWYMRVITGKTIQNAGRGLIPNFSSEEEIRNFADGVLSHPHARFALFGSLFTSLLVPYHESRFKHFRSVSGGDNLCRNDLIKPIRENLQTIQSVETEITELRYKHQSARNLLASLEQQYSLHHQVLSEKQTVYEQLRQSFQQEQDKIQKKKSEVLQLESKSAQYRADIESKQAVIAQLRNDVSEKDLLLKQYQSEVQVNKSVIDSYREQLKAKQDELGELNGLLARATDFIGRILSGNSSSDDDLSQGDALNSAEVHITREQKIAELRAEIPKIQEIISTNENRNAELGGILKSLEDQLVELRASMEQEKTGLSLAETQLTQNERAKEALRRAIESEEVGMDTLAEKVESARRDFEDRQTKNNHMETLRSEKREEMQTAQTKLEQFKASNETKLASAKEAIRDYYDSSGAMGWYIENRCEDRNASQGDMIQLAGSKHINGDYGRDWGMWQINEYFHRNLIRHGMLLDIDATIQFGVSKILELQKILQAGYNDESNKEVIYAGVGSAYCPGLDEDDQGRRASHNIYFNLPRASWALFNGGPGGSYQSDNFVGGNCRLRRKKTGSGYQIHDNDAAFKRTMQSILEFDGSVFDSYLPGLGNFAVNSEHLIERNAVKAIVREMNALVGGTGRRSLSQDRERVFESLKSVMRAMEYDYESLANRNIQFVQLGDQPIRPLGSVLVGLPELDQCPVGKFAELRVSVRNVRGLPSAPTNSNEVAFQLTREDVDAGDYKIFVCDQVEGSQAGRAEYYQVYRVKKSGEVWSIYNENEAKSGWVNLTIGLASPALTLKN